jgi:hypothetical protein
MSRYFSIIYKIKNGAKMTKIKTLGISLAVATALSFNGCGSSDSTTPPAGDDSSTGKTITGTVGGNGYAKNDIINRFLNSIVTPAYAVDLNSPDAIIVMYNNGESQKEFPINADGSFEIDTSLLNKNDLVILVVNKADKKVFGNLNLATNSDAKLDYFDKSKLTDNLALGNIDTEDNCSASSTLSSISSFSSEDLAKMEKIAISDNALILYQNKFKSPDYDAEIQALYNMDDLDNIKGSYSNINDFNTSNSIGLRPTIKTSLSAFDSIDENNIFIYPPSTVNYTTARDGNFNQEANITTAVTSTYKGTNDGNFYEFGFVENFPSGDWLLKVQGSSDIKGKFNYSAAYPYDSNGKSIVPVPQIKLNMDTSDNTKIKSVDVKWYVYNGTQYEQVSDEFMNSVALQDSDGDKFIAPLRNSGNTLGEFKSTTWNGNYIMDNNAILGFSSGNQINMSYNIGQASYQFLFRAN